MDPLKLDQAALEKQVSRFFDTGMDAFATYGLRAQAAVEGKRLSGDGLGSNAEADGELLEKVASPDADGRALLTQSAEKMRLSERGYHRILRVARTIADLDGAASVKRLLIAEVLSYRRLMPGR